MGQRVTAFTITARHPVQFCFTCEQCGKDSGWLTHIFSRDETVEASGWNATLSPSTQKEYYGKANKLLESDLQYAKKNAEKHSYPFNDKCPFCGKPQSWGAKGLWWYCIAATLSAAVISTVVLWLASALDQSWALYVIIGLASAGFLISFTYVLIKNIKAARVTHKRLPVIDWNGR